MAIALTLLSLSLLFLWEENYGYGSGHSTPNGNNNNNAHVATATTIGHGSNGSKAPAIAASNGQKETNSIDGENKDSGSAGQGLQGGPGLRQSVSLAWGCIMSDHRVLLLGLVQSLFEGGTFTFGEKCCLALWGCWWRLLRNKKQQRNSDNKCRAAALAGCGAGRTNHANSLSACVYILAVLDCLSEQRAAALYCIPVIMS